MPAPSMPQRGGTRPAPFGALPARHTGDLAQVLLWMGLIGPGLGAFGVYAIYPLLLLAAPMVAYRRDWARLTPAQLALAMLGVAILVYGVASAPKEGGVWWVKHFFVMLLSGFACLSFSMLMRKTCTQLALMHALRRFLWLVLVVAVIEMLSGLRLPVSRYASLAPALGFVYDGNDGQSLLFEGLWVPTGFYGNQNNLAFMIVCLMPFALRASRTRLEQAALSLLALGIIVVAESRIALLVLMVWALVASFLGLWRRSGALAVGALVVALPLLWVVLQSDSALCGQEASKVCASLGLLTNFSLDSLMLAQDSIGVRVQLMAQAWDLFVDSPVTGVGPGRLAQLISAVHTDGAVITDLHSPPLQVLFEYGLLGSLLWIGAVAVFVRSTLRHAAGTASRHFRMATRAFLWLLPCAAVAVSTMYYFVPLWVLIGAVFGVAMQPALALKHRRAGPKPVGAP